jgi:DNA-binding response OmpR family regulator
MKVLFVDDRETWHKLFDIVLSLRGIDVMHAKTLNEALDAVSRERPDVAIVDATISKSSGYELLPQLVKSGVPVLFIGYEKEGFNAEKALSLGALRVLKKPFTVEELISTLNEIKEKIKPLPKESELVVSFAEETPELVGSQTEKSEISVVPVFEEEKEIPVEQKSHEVKVEKETAPVKATEHVPVVEVPSEELVEKTVVETAKEKATLSGVSLPEEKVEEIIREIAWEVIPEVAEKVIREEVEKLIKSRLA